MPMEYSERIGKIKDFEIQLNYTVWVRRPNLVETKKERRKLKKEKRKEKRVSEHCERNEMLEYEGNSYICHY